MKYKIIALSIATLLSGCTTAAMKPVHEGVAKTEKEATVAMEALHKGVPIEAAPKYTAIRHVDKVWMPVQKVENTYNQKANTSLNRSVAVNRRFTSLSEAVSYITALTSIPTSTSVPVSSLSTTNTAMNGNISSLPPAPTGVMPTMNNGLPNSFNNMGATVAYNGKLSGLLDLVAARYNVSWEWEGNGIRFFKTKSKTFRLAALPGDTSLKSTVGTQSSTGGGSTDSSSSSSASSSQEAGFQFSGLSVWKGIEDSVKTMLSTDGKITVTSATGTITVDDTPLVLERVTRFIDEQNVALSRQVVINIKVLSVNLSGSHEYGINWNAVYNNVNKSLGFTLSNAISPAAGATNLTFKVLSGSMWDGSSAMIDALSKQGKVSQITSASMVTLNNQPAPIQVGKQTSYLASSQTTLGTAGAGNTTTLQPGKLTTGFSMNMLPHILDSNKLMLQYSGDISSLTKIDTVTSGGSSIQTPEVDTRNFLQRVIMNGGETLVVTGFEQFNLSGDTQGVGDAENVAVGGGVKTKHDKSVLVVLIQPVLSGNK